MTNEEEKILPFTDPAMLRMRLIPDGLSLEMMIVCSKRERHSLTRLCKFVLPTVNLFFFFFFESRDLRATSILTTKTHGRIKSTCLLEGRRVGGVALRPVAWVV